MVDLAISLDLVGLGVADTTVSTVNESLSVVNKEVCGLHVFPFFVFSFPLSTGLTVSRRVYDIYIYI